MLSFFACLSLFFSIWIEKSVSACHGQKRNQARVDTLPEPCFSQAGSKTLFLSEAKARAKKDGGH